MSLFKKMLIILSFLLVNSTFALELKENMEVILTSVGANHTMDIRSNNASVGTLYRDAALNYSLYDAKHTVIRSFTNETPFYDILYTTISIWDENNLLLNVLYKKNQFLVYSIYDIYSADNHKLATVTSNISHSVLNVFSGSFGPILITLTWCQPLISKNPGYLIHIDDLEKVRSKHIDVATLLAIIAMENNLSS